MSIIGATYRNVSLSATGNDTERIGLNETVIAVRRQAEHYLAQCNYLSHFSKIFLLLLF
jgi:hypothetical protein